MDVILFSQRLTRLLAGEEGTMLDGAKECIQQLQSAIEIMVSFIRGIDYPNLFEDLWSYMGSSFLHDLADQYKDDKDDDEEVGPQREYLINLAINLAKFLITSGGIFPFVRECEKAIDTCIVNIMQHKSKSSSKDLCDALQKLLERYFHIIYGIQTQAYHPSSSLGTARRDRKFINEKPAVVGVEDRTEMLLDLLIEGPASLSVIAIVEELEGVLISAKELYDNNYVKNYFDCYAFVRLTRASNPSKRILEDIMMSVMPSFELSKLMETDLQTKKTALRDYLSNKRYLLILPVFVGEENMLENLREALLDNFNGSRILTEIVDTNILNLFRLENGKEIWVDGLLTVTGPLRVTYRDHSFILLYFGRKLLHKNDNNLLDVNWIRCSAYFNLPFHLKPCFCYFVAFHSLQGEIETRHLYQLWIAEGFIPDNSVATAEKYLDQLIDQGLLQVRRRTSGGRIKICNIPVLSLVLSMFVACTVECITNIEYLFGTQMARETLKLLSLSIHGNPTVLLSSPLSLYPNLRSLLYLFSQGNKDPVDCNYISENFKLLRLLDLGTLVVKQWPVGIENLLLLRYLKLNIPSLTTIPSSLCNLVNLFTLDLPSSHIHHTPDDIWKMKELKHLNVGLINLPAPSGKYSSSLENLNFIYTLDPLSCTQDILARLTNLQSLRICGNLSSCQSVLSKSLCELRCLESLKLVNESKISQTSSIVLGDYHFPERLTHPSLSNTELKDDPMQILEKLAHLQVLKLKQQSYSGRKLVCGSDGFPKLEVLHLKSMLWLEEWTMGARAMPKLESVIINPCAHLRKRPEELCRIKSFHKLELWWPRQELKQRLRELEDMERYDIKTYPFGL